MFIEGNWSKLYDYLGSLNPNVVGIFEYGEMKTIKEKVGKTMCIMGNYPIEALKSHSTEQCIDIAKKMIAEGAPGGGYIFTTGKAILRGKGLDLEKLPGGSSVCNRSRKILARCFMETIKSEYLDYFESYATRHPELTDEDRAIMADPWDVNEDMLLGYVLSLLI